ncbi:hypothetical protein [Blastococcus mobilis]|uniref:Uncharacterized protein n=1 Tax=Blastococcus mobilis TaxID=1938746 RepID=A0A238US03_9ACTN|nr:hypothetical protein [Blastococcus mobilis]SNR24223.1 hypothetical protein SAMN06272737_101230 [Blastococcus mobilis]
MRPSPVATFAAVAAGVTVAVALRRRAGRRLVATTTAPSPLAPVEPGEPVAVREAVVLPFLRPVVPAPATEQPAAPARCGDSGGRTKAGVPCAARATTGGRCHRHPIAA